VSSLSRRTLLKAATAGGAVAGIGGFSALSQMLAPLMAGADDGLTAFQPPAAKDIDDASHVLNRLTFGPRPGQHAEVTALGARPFIAAQLDPASIDDRWIEARAARFEALRAWPLGELLEYDARELLDQLTRKKILHAVHSKRQLHEVMVDFWSDHFNIDPSKGDSKWLKPADDREVIRAHALGSFPAMLKASALSPSMLWYLDGRVNRRAGDSERPNENYGRELLELHSLGVAWRLHPAGRHGSRPLPDRLDRPRTREIGIRRRQGRVPQGPSRRWPQDRARHRHPRRTRCGRPRPRDRNRRPSSRHRPLHRGETLPPFHRRRSACRWRSARSRKPSSASVAKSNPL
jgi:hypothetical protein